jgi:hypothetical protein
MDTLCGQRIDLSRRHKLRGGIGLGLAIALLLLFGAQAEGAGVRPHLPSLSHSGFSIGCGDTVDKNGYLYATDAGTVRLYDTAGAEVTSFASTGACGLAVDSNGTLYVQAAKGAVSKYIPSDFPPVSTTSYTLDGSINESSPGAHDGNGVIDSASTRGVAVDPATGDVYTSHPGINEKQGIAPTGMVSDVGKFAIGNLPPACSTATTAEITFSSIGATRRERIDNALEAACSGASPQSELAALNGGDFRVGATASPLITFQGHLAAQNFPLLTCTATEGTCTITASADGAGSALSQFHSNGTLVSNTVGNGLVAADYSGLDVYATNGRVYAFDGNLGRIAIFDPGASNPLRTIDGSSTPAGSMGAKADTSGNLIGDGLAVDQATGHAFVYDGLHDVVNEFQSNGDYVTQLANSFTTTNFPGEVAVDNSGGTNNGTIYVVMAAGVEAFGDLAHDHLPSLSHSGFSIGCGDTVDKNGYLYATDAGTVRLYDTAGAEVTSFASTGACGLAVDSNGTLYVQAAKGAVSKYIPSDFPPVSTTSYTLDGSINESSPGAHDGNGVIDSASTRGVAVDPATGDVYTSHPGINEKQGIAPTGMVSDVGKFAIGNLPPACSTATTAEITFSSIGATRRERIDNALEAACSGASPQSELAALNGGDFRVGATASPLITFQGHLAAQNFPLLTCTATEGTCTITASADGAGSALSQFHSNGTLVSNTVGNGLVAADYSGLDVYATNGRVYAFDGNLGRIAIFDPGASNPLRTIDGSSTPAGSMGAKADTSGNLIGDGLAVDQATGHAFVYDGLHDVVNEFQSNGDYVTQLANSFTTTNFPGEVAVDNSGGTNNGTIYVVMAAGVEAFGPVSAGGNPQLSIIKSGPGSGTVSSVPSGIACGPTCESEFESGTEVVLTATPALGSSFDPDTGWNQNDCDSVDDQGRCHVLVDENTAVRVTFIKRTLLVSKVGSGNGDITSQPAGISCGSICQGTFDDGSSVILTSVADTGSKFIGWTSDSDCDSIDDEGHCTVAMTSDKQVTARFASQPIVNDERASEITDSSARLDASINPTGSETFYSFEYISDAAWLANGKSFTGQNSTGKTPPTFIGAENVSLPVNVKIEGLVPFTTYHFRVTATNEAGTALGERDELDEEIPHIFTTHATSQNDTDCPNQSFRGGVSAPLPDCRAYEQATPVDKNGGSIQGKAPIARASLEGDAISFESPAGIPGGSGSQEFPTYVGRRGLNAWATMGLLPNATTGQSAKWLGWSPDFDEVFDEVQRFGQGTALITRSTLTGNEQAIVPYTRPIPQYFYVGSSNDGSTVVFDARDTTETDLALTEKAAPGKPNVYAWDRGNPAVIQLAGVLPDGSTPTEGTTSGRPGEYAVDLHRVLANGSVFFTDVGTEKIYLRLNPAAKETPKDDEDGNCEPDPVLACTIPVSASQRTKGNGLGGRDAAGSQPAVFMGATADGSSTFFLSTEKLTNDATTGPEPGLPAIVRSDDKNADSNKDLKFIPTSAHEIAIDEVGGYVYWTDPEHGQIGRAQLADGGDFTKDYIPGPGNPRLEEPQGIAVIDQGVSQYIFWTERGELDSEGKPKAGVGSIGRADLDASDVKVDCVTGITNPRSIAVDANYIYWTMPGISEGAINQGLGTTGRVDLSCAPGSLNTKLVKEGVDTSGDIAVDSGHIYVSSFAAGGKSSFIYRYELDGSGSPFSGNYPISMSGVSSAASIAVDDSNLYWTNPTLSEIGRAELDGSNRDSDFITDASLPEDLSVDSGHLYWSASQKLVSNLGTDLYRYDHADGKLQDLTIDHEDRNGMEVQGVVGVSQDGSFVYFAANGVPDEVGNSPNKFKEVAQPGNCKGNGGEASGMCNLYVYHGGSIDFIARLDAEGGSEGGSGDAENWVRGRAELGRIEFDKTARVSDDGRVLVFRSVRSLTGYGNEGSICGRAPDSLERIPGPCTEFYRFTYDEKGLACISCDPRGEAPNGPARIASIRPPGFGAVAGTAVLSRNLSRDGDRFFFETPDALVSADVNGEDGCSPWGGMAQKASSLACQDVYEWEAPGTGSCKEDLPAFSAASGGCVYLITTGKSDQASFFADADSDGENAFIFTYDRLVGQDEDSLMDVYDVRVEGGLSGQNQPKATLCYGEACKPPQPPIETQNVGSSSFSGPGDPPVKRSHSKKHKKHGKKHKKGKHTRQGRNHRKKKAGGERNGEQARHRAAGASGGAGR